MMKLKIKNILLILLCCSSIINLSGCKNIQDSKINDDKKITTENTQTQMNEYAEDDIVNTFIKDFKAASSYELTNIKKGNIKTKYFVHINNQYCELINATDNQANYFSITINGGNQDNDVDKIINIYREVIKSLDSSITDDMLNETISTYMTSSNEKKEFSINDKISVTFFPIKKLSYGNTDCRIEIITTKYN